MSLKLKIKLEGKVIKKIDEKPDINRNNGLRKVDSDKNEPKGYRVERDLLKGLKKLKWIL